MATRIKPLFMWAGGKTKMIPKYLANPGLPSFDGQYVEPFVGGGAMLCWMYENTNRRNFVINDINKEIIEIYKTIRSEECSHFIQGLMDLTIKFLPLKYDDRKKFFYDLRSEYHENNGEWSQTKESTILYFLLKTAFNGIYQTSKKYNNKFNTSCGLLNQTRKEQIVDVENISRWYNLLQYCWEPSSIDANLLLKKDLENDVVGNFYFLDPPYRDSHADYGQSFSDTDKSLIELIELASQLSKNNYVFLCNRKTEDNFMEKNKMNLNICEYPITYTAGRRLKTKDGYEAKKATEILLYRK